MSAEHHPRVVPGAAACLCLTIALATTMWSAKPIYGPLRREFDWSPAVLFAAGGASLVLSAAVFNRACRAATRYGARTMATLGSLGSGLLILLALPTMTHLWQLAGALLLLGVLRASIGAAAWRELRRCAGCRGAVAAAIGCGVVSLVVVTPWIAQIVYRNSWREGVIACAGPLILLAAPAGYILLPGTEVDAAPAAKPQHG